MKWYLNHFLKITDSKLLQGNKIVPFLSEDFNLSTSLGMDSHLKLHEESHVSSVLNSLNAGRATNNHGQN